MRLVLGILGLVSWAGASLAEIQSIPVHSYKHWNVEYLYSDDGDRWNACVMQVEGDGIALSVNVYGSQQVDLQLFDANADYDDWDDGDMFQLRVDRHPKWDLPAKGNGNSLFVRLSDKGIEQSVERLFYEIRQGLKLYIYNYGSDEAYYWFSLHGSKAAANAVVDQCFPRLQHPTQWKPEPKKTPPTAAVPGLESPVPGLPSTQYDLRIEEASVGTVAYFSGTISKGFYEDVRALGDFDYFVIEESNGGLIGEAMATGALFRKKGVATSVDGSCASACVELYAAGVKRYLSKTARFGIHAMAVDGDESSLSATQSLLSKRVKYFEAGGVDPRIVMDSLDTPAEALRWLTTEQARDYGLIP